MPVTKLEFSEDSYEVKVPDLSDDEQYITVTDSDGRPTGKYINSSGHLVGNRESSVLRRDTEIDMLRTLAEFAANNEKETKKSLLMLDLLEQIDNLDGESCIDLSVEDIERLRGAYEELAKRRPSVWLRRCRNMIRQLL